MLQSPLEHLDVVINIFFFFFVIFIAEIGAEFCWVLFSVATFWVGGNYSTFFVGHLGFYI